MPGPLRFRLPTVIMLVALVAMAIALARSEIDNRRLRAEIEVLRPQAERYELAEGRRYTLQYDLMAVLLDVEAAGIDYDHIRDRRLSSGPRTPRPRPGPPAADGQRSE